MVRLKQIFWVLFLLLFWQGFGWAAPGKISIQSTVSKSKITLGDTITYTVTVTREPDVKVKLPQLAENLGQFEIRDYKVFNPVKKNGKIIDRVQYKISTFDVGDFKIPPIAVAYSIPPDTTEHLLKSEAIKITVESLAPSAEGDIKDIKPPVELPFDWKPVIRYGLAGFFLLLLLAIGIYFWMRRRKGKPLLPQKTEPRRPPHEIALEALERLRESNLLEKQGAKAYYSEISEIIRRYIEGRFGIEAMDLTSTELLAELEKVLLEDALMKTMTEMTDLSDLVKFAKYQPTDEENARILEMAFEFVRETLVVPEISEPEANEPAEMETAEEEVVSAEKDETAESGGEE